MVRSRTVHVIPDGKTWAVKGDGRASSIHRTKKDAVAYARSLARSADSGQFVVHGLDGRIVEQAAYHLPKIQDPPGKSTLGRKKIEKAVSAVVLHRLN